MLNGEYDCGEFEITQREILASIPIIVILLVIGIFISTKISEWNLDRNEVYNKAVKIESQDLFQYGMNTNIGNAFVYGDLKALDPVTYPELEGEYAYVKKVKERYTMHTRQVSHTRTVNGKTQTYYTTETYWTWDTVWTEKKKCENISFCGVEFPVKKIDLPQADYITMIKESSKIRYKYYGIKTEYTGTIFAELKDKTISDHTSFYGNHTIDETVEMLKSNGVIPIIFFWLLWIIFSGCVVYGFYYLDNDWLK